MTKIKKVSLNNRLFIVFLILPFLEPEFLNFHARINAFFLLWEIFNCLFLIYIYIKKRQFSPYFGVIFLWRFYIGLISLIKNGNIDKTSLGRTVFILGLTLAIELGLKSAPMDTLWGLFYVMLGLSSFNLLSCFTNGMVVNNGVPYYVFGLRTRFTDSAVPLITLSLLLSWFSEHKLFSKISITALVIVVVQLLVKWVATGIFVVLILLLVVMISDHYSWRIPPRTSLLVGIGFIISIVFFRIQSLFSFIIVNLLHKSLDFHGRIEIWNAAIKVIKTSLFTGFGEKGDGGFVYVWWAPTLAPAHDMLLQLLHDGGLISCALLLLAYYLAVNNLRNIDKRTANILTAAVLATCFAVLTEITSYYAYFYILPVLCSCAQQLRELGTQENDPLELDNGE
ncbi:hypothetical protein C5Z25_10870 [Lactobacillus sp. CBA3605]|uniref:O-antigen ligase family protein n=1 Tax=Lactobacillus sp. CBA3605 TaxID=2099788 RepID=UPI000CFAB327|nr:O-antigen ligase family protein [Lactobacillus sp. CBA3605]AVK62243.1 hypothetical protein C5Z25_10870 [Lactobacillus sp. CBA3605]